MIRPCPNREVEEIRAALREEASVDRAYLAQLLDRKGELHAEVEKVIHIRLR